MKDFKQFFTYGVALALTYFGFLCMSFPYFFINLWQGVPGVPVNGYSALTLWDYGWSGILVSILQIFELLLMAGILIVAIIGVFSEVLSQKTGTPANPYLQKTVFFMLLANLCLDFLVLVFVIVMTAVNDFSLNAGLFLKLFFDGAAFAGLLLSKYFFSDKPVIKNRPLSEKTDSDRDDF